MFKACFSHTYALAVAAVFAAAGLATAEPKLDALFQDHMILQRDRPAAVWGTAVPGEQVTVRFADQTKQTQAEADGRWQVKLDAMPASAEGRMLTAGTQSRQDVLVGDIWLCSGQSNMAMAVRECDNAEQEIAAANYPGIRYFPVAGAPSPKPLGSVKGGTWTVCSPQSVATYSAAGYYFGRELHRKLNVPIGLVSSCVPATRVEAWTRLGALETLPELGKIAHEQLAQLQAQEGDNQRFRTLRAQWEKKYGVEPPAANLGQDWGWAEPALDCRSWKKVSFPNTWEQLGFKSGGVFWVRKEVDIPATEAGKSFRLALNAMDEQYDIAYFNGVEIGRAGEQPPCFYQGQRLYQVPAKLVHAGRNVIAVRVVAASEKSRLWPRGALLGIPGSPASLDNDWLLNQETAFPGLPAQALAERPKPNTIGAAGVSSSLYNGMIAPLMPFAIKGAIWYQGESNAGRPGYQEALTLMIKDWRAKWGQGDFPFIIQQLVNCNPAATDPNVCGGWPLLREAQSRVAETVPNVGISVAIELGDAFNGHPKNKQEIGRRLALVALEKTYAQPCESNGPRYASLKIEAGSIRVSFTHAQGLYAKGGPLKGFAVAGADKKFAWAEARIEGETVVVSSAGVPHPVAVRYAWADNPEGCNLYNAAGLPAHPFRAE